MAELLGLPIEGSIICHAWNHDKTQIALSANSKDVLIYSKCAGKWTLTQSLTEHTSKVLGIDWAPNSNRILTCGADKNAYVWNYDGKVWKPELVVLRINRAATCCKWSPEENKFAVGCGLRCICVCYYEKNQEFWVSKHIKKPLRSTILCLDWHPNNILLAAGGADYKCRVYSAYIKEIDGDEPKINVWSSKITFADCIAEYGTSSNGWVYSVSFNLSGDCLAWVGHDSSIYLVNAEKNIHEITFLRTPFLPFMSIKFLTDNTLVAAGHDCYPILFTINSGKISVLEKLTVGQSTNNTNLTSAKAKFQNVDRLKTETITTIDQNTIHQNTIKQISSFNAKNKEINKISTCGLDGIIVIWDFQALENQFSGLKIK